MFSSSEWNAVTVGQFYPPDRGRYRIRISARAVQSNGKPVAFRVDAGPMLMGTKNHLVDYFEVAGREAEGDRVHRSLRGAGPHPHSHLTAWRPRTR